MEENPEYLGCLFYIYREQEETVKKATSEKKKDRAIAALYNVEEKDPNKLKIIASDIFGNDTSEMSVEQAYIRLKEFLEVSEPKAQKENIARFMDSVNKTPEEMQIKRVLDKAIKRRVVTTKGNIFKRGEEIYGNNYEEALDFLKSPENSGELASLQKELNRK